jgi:hypothetical protein
VLPSPRVTLEKSIDLGLLAMDLKTRVSEGELPIAACRSLLLHFMLKKDLKFNCASLPLYRRQIWLADDSFVYYYDVSTSRLISAEWRDSTKV